MGNLQNLLGFEETSALKGTAGTADRRALSAIRRNTFAIAGVRFGSFALDGVAYLITARYLGPATYGTYLSLIAFTALMDVAGDMSLMDITVREMSHEDRPAGRILGAATTLRACFSLFGLSAYIGYVWWSRFTGETLLAAWIAGLSLAIGAFRMPLALFRARLKMHFELGIVIAARVANLLIVGGLIAAHGRLSGFLGAALASRTLLALLAWTATYTFFKTKVSFVRAECHDLLLKSAPLAFAGVLVAVQLKGDILLVSRQLGAMSAGLYGVIAQIAEYSLYIPVIITTPVLPVLSRAYSRFDLTRFYGFYQKLFETTFAVALPITLVLALRAHQSIALVFGSKYDAAAGLLPLLALAMFAMWISHIVAIAAVASALQTHFIWIQSICAATYLGLDVILIPRTGLSSAVIVRVATCALAAALTYSVVRRYTGARLHVSAVAKPLIAGIVMTAIDRTCAWLPLLVALPVAAIVYLSTLRALQTILPLNKHLDKYVSDCSRCNL